MSNIVLTVRKELQENADDKTKASLQRFFKEKVLFHGVKSHLVEKVAKENFKNIQNRKKKEIFDLCEELLQSGYCEEAWVAANWAYALRKDFEPADFQTFERWVGKYIDNWAECDTLCNHTVGSFLEQYPKYVEKLKAWTKSKNRWVKRAAAVSFIIPAKEGKFLKDIFDIADSLLMDSDDMVQKGYGWLLKEASRLHQKDVFEYVMKHKRKMPRTALRYAIEKMPPELRAKAMEKETSST
ncbi:MAG TPA: DNA alkylation repair protein [Patescibacteria group bacterium]|nr:DNA alkylation repair protein [Patescibacteria group bacterium]